MNRPDDPLKENNEVQKDPSDGYNTVHKDQSDFNKWTSKPDKTRGRKFAQATGNSIKDWKYQQNEDTELNKLNQIEHFPKSSHSLEENIYISPSIDKNETILQYFASDLDSTILTNNSADSYRSDNQTPLVVQESAMLSEPATVSIAEPVPVGEPATVAVPTSFAGLPILTEQATLADPATPTAPAIMVAQATLATLETIAEPAPSTSKQLLPFKGWGARFLGAIRRPFTQGMDQQQRVPADLTSHQHNQEHLNDNDKYEQSETEENYDNSGGKPKHEKRNIDDNLFHTVNQPPFEHGHQHGEDLGHSSAETASSQGVILIHEK